MNIKNLQIWILENCFDSSGNFNPVKLRYSATHKNIILKYTPFLSDDCKLSQRCWHILNETFEIPHCLHCGKNLKFRKFGDGYGMFCNGKCFGKSSYKKEKTKSTCLKKYGVDHYFMLNSVREKSKETCLENYGVENPSQSPIIKQRKIETCLSNFGVDHPSQSVDVREKSKETTLENYGVENPSQSPIIKQLKKKTMMKNYGVPNPIYLTTRNGYKYHLYEMPSGKIIKLQGYEPKLMDNLLLTYSEDDILYEKQDMPEIWYLSSENNTWHRYYPDFYIPKENLVLEVKSEYTYKANLQMNIDKKEATICLGYNYILEIL